MHVRARRRFLTRTGEAEAGKTTPPRACFPNSLNGRQWRLQAGRKANSPQRQPRWTDGVPAPSHAKIIMELDETPEICGPSEMLQDGVA